jgi:hypothetical protein
VDYFTSIAALVSLPDFSRLPRTRAVARALTQVLFRHPAQGSFAPELRNRQHFKARIRAPSSLPRTTYDALGAFDATGPEGWRREQHWTGWMTMNKFMMAVALASALTTPTLALAQPGHRARAQAPAYSVDSTRMSPQRVQALKDCTALEQKWDQRTWGVQQLDVYRECMYSHGQAE